MTDDDIAARVAAGKLRVAAAVAYQVAQDEVTELAAARCLADKLSGTDTKSKGRRAVAEALRDVLPTLSHTAAAHQATKCMTWFPKPAAAAMVEFICTPAIRVLTTLAEADQTALLNTLTQLTASVPPAHWRAMHNWLSTSLDMEAPTDSQASVLRNAAVPLTATSPAAAAVPPARLPVPAVNIEQPAKPAPADRLDDDQVYEEVAAAAAAGRTCFQDGFTKPHISSANAAAAQAALQMADLHAMLCAQLKAAAYQRDINSEHGRSWTAQEPQVLQAAATWGQQAAHTVWTNSLQRARQPSGKAPVLVDWCAGTGSMAHAAILSADSFRQILAVDIDLPKAYDAITPLVDVVELQHTPKVPSPVAAKQGAKRSATGDAVPVYHHVFLQASLLSQQDMRKLELHLRHLQRAGHALLFHCSPPCTEFAMNNTTPRGGQRDLPTAMALVRAFIDMALNLQAVFVLENPATSMLWPLLDSLGLPLWLITDMYCQFGADYMKTTAWACSDPHLWALLLRQGCVCPGKFMCRAAKTDGTGHRKALTSQHGGRNRSVIPPQLCRGIVDTLVYFAAHPCPPMGSWVRRLWSDGAIHYGLVFDVVPGQATRNKTQVNVLMARTLFDNYQVWDEETFTLGKRDNDCSQGVRQVQLTAVPPGIVADLTRAVLHDESSIRETDSSFWPHVVASLHRFRHMDRSLIPGCTA